MPFIGTSDNWKGQCRVNTTGGRGLGISIYAFPIWFPPYHNKITLQQFEKPDFKI